MLSWCYSGQSLVIVIVIVIVIDIVIVIVIDIVIVIVIIIIMGIITGEMNALLGFFLRITIKKVTIKILHHNFRFLGRDSL